MFDYESRCSLSQGTQLQCSNTGAWLDVSTAVGWPGVCSDAGPSLFTWRWTANQLCSPHQRHNLGEWSYFRCSREILVFSGYCQATVHRLLCYISQDSPGVLDADVIVFSHVFCLVFLLWTLGMVLMWPINLNLVFCDRKWCAGSMSMLNTPEMNTPGFKTHVLPQVWAQVS